MKKMADVLGKIENTVVVGYRTMENGIVGGYKKMETGIVDGFTRLTDRCVETLFARERETVEQARARLSRRG